jgi:MraZ protein
LALSLALSSASIYDRLPPLFVKRTASLARGQWTAMEPRWDLVEKNGQKWSQLLRSFLRRRLSLEEGAMFRGSAPAKIDDKGRLKIPTDFRRAIEERYGLDLFVTSIEGDSALLYPLPVWEEIEARLGGMASTDRVKARYLERVNYYGQQSRLDNQGRLLIPPILRESAGMSGEVVVSAQLDHLVVWNRDRFARRLDEQPFTEEDFRALSERGI